MKEPFRIYNFAFVHESPNTRKQQKQERKQGRKKKTKEKERERQSKEKGRETQKINSQKHLLGCLGLSYSHN